MKQAIAARLFTAIQRQYPELVAEVIEGFKPALTDTSLIPGFYTYYQSTQPHPSNLDEIFNHKLLFICAILHLYDPVSLKYGVIATKRLCSILGQTLGFNNRQSVSNLKAQARLFIKNPRFKETVKQLSKEFLGFSNLE